MAETFADLGLSDVLVAAARDAGYERPTPLQEAAVPLVRRGANVVLHASSGAGVTATYALGLLDRLSGEAATDSVRGLVLVPTGAIAARVVDAIGQLAVGTTLRVRHVAAGWRHADADILVTTPAVALETVQASGLKLDNVSTLVVVAADEMHALGAGDALKTLTSLLAADAQRVIVSANLDEAVTRFVETHVRRPMTVPARPADRAEAARHREPVGQIGYVVLQESEKPDILARLLEGVAGGALVFARTGARARRAGEALSRRGVANNVRYAAFGTASETSDRIISYDVPPSAADLRAAHETGGTVFVTPAELSHFRRIAGEVPFALKQRRAKPLEESALDSYRASVRAAIEGEDISAQMLVLDPLFEEYSPVEVAAALSAMVRRRSPAKVRSAEPAGSVAGAAPKQAVAGGLTRLFLSIGTRDNIRPGDIVGAITGEAGIKGEQVGRVDIRDSFSVVEINTDVADKVIRALNGTTMKGRSLRVDFDRKGGGDARRDEGGGRSARAPRGDAGPRKPGGRDGPRGDSARGPSGPRRRPTER